jgi:phosphate-selective porin OprO and OprP
MYSFQAHRRTPSGVRIRIGEGVIAGSIVTVLALAAGSARADELSDLRDRLEAQEQKIKVLERKLELNDEAAKTAAASTPVVKAGPKGFNFASPDNANQVRLRGTLHFDGRYFLDDTASDASDTWLLRRVRPILEGTLYNIFDFRFTPDFAQGKTIVQDAYGAIRLRPWAVVTAGKFKVPVGLERIASANDLKFIERGLPTNLVPNRDLGVQFGGDIAGGVVQYSVGVFNGVVDGGSSDSQVDTELDADRDWAARLFFQPFLNSDAFALRGLGFGVAATYVDVLGTPVNPQLPTYRTPDQQAFFRFRGDNAATAGVNEAAYLDGKRLRVTPQAYYYLGSFGALAEYASVKQDVSRNPGTGVVTQELENTAWQLELSYFLSGEEATFKSFTPIGTFNVGAPGWGAFEIVARYGEMEIDGLAFDGGFADPATQASKVSQYTVGLNWYFNQNFKWQIDYEYSTYKGGAPNGADRGDGEAILTRFAIGF